MRVASVYAKSRGGTTTVRVLFRPDGAAFDIRRVICKLDDRVVFAASMGGGMPPDPSFEFRLRGAKPGDRIEIVWTAAGGVSRSMHGTVV